MMHTNDPMRLKQALSSKMIRGRALPDDMSIRGRHRVQLFDRFGKPKSSEIWIPNGITTAAKNSLFDAYFNDGTRWTTWYVSLIDNDGFTALNAGDTLVSHAGWTEFTDYKRADDNTTDRVVWGQGAANSGQVINASQMSFIFIADGAVAGIMVTSHILKGNSDGSKMLWSTALFSAPLSVTDGDELRVTYSVSA